MGYTAGGKGKSLSSGLVLRVGAYVIESSQELAAKAGGGQSGATPINSEIARVTTVATAGDSVVLPAAVPGLDVMVINHGANPMQVFGTGTDTIDDAVAATGVSQMVNSVCIFCCTIAGKWYANGLGTGFAGAFETQSYQDAIAATASGTQGSSVKISTMLSRFTTVASGAGTGLPTAVPGMNLTVINAGANPLSVFPDVGSSINGGTVNAAYALAAGKSATFYTTVTGAWHAVLSA